MKDIEETEKLFQLLLDKAETAEEKKLIEDCRKEITALPIIEVLDENHQRFYGKFYQKDSNGYFRRGKKLHRVVWEFYNGEIPRGYHIHHKDFNPANNDISNLQMVSRSEHQKIHNPKGLPVARAKKKIFICQVCGKEYEAFANGNNKFCSKKCTEEFRKRHLKKTCALCGKEFWTSRERVNYCSHSCHTRAMNIQKKAERMSKIFVCRNCGKSYKGSESNSDIYCSQSCASKFFYKSSKVKRTCIICGKEFKTFKNAAASCKILSVLWKRNFAKRPALQNKNLLFACLFK